MTKIKEKLSYVDFQIHEKYRNTWLQINTNQADRLRNGWVFLTKREARSLYKFLGEVLGKEGENG